MKKTIILVSLGAIFLIVGIVLFKNKQTIEGSNKVVDRSSIPIAVSVVHAAMRPVKTDFVLPGIVEPIKEADITVNASGRLKKLNIELGSIVKKGAIIGMIDNSLLEITLASNQISLERYEKDYLRYKILYEGKAATELDYNTAKYNYQEAKNQAAKTRQEILDATIRSPLNGVIIKKNVEEGEFVKPGDIVAAIITNANLKASVMMSESDVYRIKSGMSVSLSADVFPGKTFKGSVAYVSSKGNEAHNYQVDINIQNNGTQLKAGTFIRVAFNINNSSEVLQIPKIALIEGMQDPYVYIAYGNRAEKRKLVLGREAGEMVEVLSGIGQSEQLIVSGQINLSQGSLIEVLNAK